MIVLGIGAGGVLLYVNHGGSQWRERLGLVLLTAGAYFLVAPAFTGEG